AAGRPLHRARRHHKHIESLLLRPPCDLVAEAARLVDDVHAAAVALVLAHQRLQVADLPGRAQPPLLHLAPTAGVDPLRAGEIDTEDYDLAGGRPRGEVLLVR